MRDRFAATVAVSSRPSSPSAEPVERDARNELRFLAFVFSRNSCDRPNVLTLSCKSRPPHRGSPGGAAAAATNMQWRERTAADVTPARPFGAAPGGPAPRPAARGVLLGCGGR